MLPFVDFPATMPEWIALLARSSAPKEGLPLKTRLCISIRCGRYIYIGSAANGVLGELTN